MIYVFDSNSWVVLKNFYPERFPSLWQRINALIDAGELISVREVKRELESYADDDLLKRIVKERDAIFGAPGPHEQIVVQEILADQRFHHLITPKAILQGKPVADPFLIAAAKARGATVVTEERKRERAAKIPNVCDAIGVPCMNLEQFMAAQAWEF